MMGTYSKTELNGRHIKVTEKTEASKRSLSVGCRSPRSRSRSADKDKADKDDDRKKK